jgi:hypothetical protein
MSPAMTRADMTNDIFDFRLALVCSLYPVAGINIDLR